jgi:hypothetical protein
MPHFRRKVASAKQTANERKKMKTIKPFAPLLVCAIAVTACKPVAPPPDPRLPALEARLGTLESLCASNTATITNLNENYVSLILLLSSNAIGMAHDSDRINRMSDLCALQLNIVSNLNKRLAALENPQPGSRVATTARRNAPTEMKYGVPAAVYDKIAADAEKLYPNSYDLQVTVINMELNAYKELHP